MKDDKITKKHFTDLMNDYKSGKKGVQPGHPKEVEIAIEHPKYNYKTKITKETREALIRDFD